LTSNILLPSSSLTTPRLTPRRRDAASLSRFPPRYACRISTLRFSFQPSAFFATTVSGQNISRITTFLRAHFAARHTGCVVTPSMLLPPFRFQHFHFRVEIFLTPPSPMPGFLLFFFDAGFIEILFSSLQPLAFDAATRHCFHAAMPTPFSAYAALSRLPTCQVTIRFDTFIFLFIEELNIRQPSSARLAFARLHIDAMTAASRPPYFRVSRRYSSPV
jgi:hypothetical protein